LTSMCIFMGITFHWKSVPFHQGRDRAPIVSVRLCRRTHPTHVCRPRACPRDDGPKAHQAEADEVAAGNVASRAVRAGFVSAIVAVAGRPPQRSQVA